ncbi:MAG: hypothetical protein NW217_04425 [Hyphomicrobiaceae bacterium]|nr:hypothetical protein [Hyphomicrobiaceae bacterium]
MKTVIATILAATVFATASFSPAAAASRGEKIAAVAIVGLAAVAVLAAKAADHVDRHEGRGGHKYKSSRVGYKKHKLNKYGFTTEKVWERPGCNKLKRQCKSGSENACVRFEDRCQIN